MALEQTLTQLEGAQLVRQLEQVEATYQFRHTLTQETVYQSLLRSTRREVHLRVAQAYEQLYTDRLDEHAALLAQHYGQAGKDAKTLEYATRAGNAAARVYAHAEAETHYARAIEIAKRGAAHDRASLQDLFLKRGRVLELSGRYDDALANYAALETGARARNDRALELAALMARATIFSIPSKQSTRAFAQVLCDQALELARATGDQPAEAKILWNLLLLNTRLATNYRQAIEYGEQALAIARKLGLREQVAYLMNDLSLPYAYDGDPDRGEQLNLEARQMWQAANNLPMLADNLSYAAMIYNSRAKYADAIVSAQAANEISLKIGNVWGEAFSQSWVGQAYRELGHITQAIAAMENAIRTAPFGFQAPLSFTRADLACLYGDLGMIARGIELAQIAHVQGEKHAQVMKIWTSAQLAHLYLRDGQIERAAGLIAEAIQHIKPNDYHSLFGAAIQLAEAELMLVQNDLSRALQVCERLIAYRRGHHLRQFLPNVLYLKGLALQRQGNLEDAVASLADARTEAESTNTRWTLWRILTALAEIEQARGKPSRGVARPGAHGTRLHCRPHT